MNYQGLIPIMIKGIQEQGERIKSLENRLEELEEILLSKINETEIEPNNTSVELADLTGVVLNQNTPTPFKERTSISYFIDENVSDA